MSHISSLRRRLVTVVWCGYTLLTMLMLTRSSVRAAWAFGILWAVGSLFFWRACRRPGAEITLNGFLQARSARVALCVWLATVLLLPIFAAPTASAFCSMLLFVWLLVLWAFSRDATTLRQRVARWLLLGFSFAACAVVVEGVLAWTYSRRPANDYVTVTWGHAVTTNRFGFREQDFDVPKPANRFRVMVVGDSFTWGSGLAVAERYTEVLQEALRRRVHTLDVEVLNFGRPSTTTVQHQQALEKHLDAVGADVVVLGFCINDPQPRAQHYAQELERFRWLFALTDSLPRAGLSYSGRFLHTRADQGLRNLGLVPQWWTALDRCYATKTSEWRAFEKALQDFVASVRRRDLPAPIFAPLLYGRGDFQQPDERLRLILKWCRQAAEAARRAGFVLVDMEPEFLEQGNRDRWVNAWDGHPSAECNRIYARHLRDAILPALEAAQSRSFPRLKD